jgi:ferredoxin
MIDAVSLSERFDAAECQDGSCMPIVTVTIEPSLCILAANCVGMEPKLFQIGSEPHVELLDSNGTMHGSEYKLETTEAELEKIEDAAESCPTRAISVTRG